MPFYAIRVVARKISKYIKFFLEGKYISMGFSNVEIKDFV